MSRNKCVLGLTPEVTLQPLVGSADSRLDKVSLSSLAELVCLKKGVLKDSTSIFLAQQVCKGGSLHERRPLRGLA